MSEIAKVEEGAVKLEEIALIVSSSGVTYQKNKESHKKAIEFANGILEQSKTGITIEIYNSAKNCLSKLKVTEEALKERRKPLTQIMDALKKEFTKFESELSNKGEIALKLQGILNSFAEQQEKIRLENERVAAIKLKTETEKNNVIFDYESEVYKCFESHVFLMKKELIDILNQPKTLEELVVSEEKIKNYSQTYTLFNQIVFNKKYEYITIDDINEILKTYDKASLQEKLSSNYKKEVEISIKENIDKIPSKKESILEQIKLDEEKKIADEKRLAELKKIEDDKILAENKRIEDEKAELKKQSEESIQKQLITTNTNKSTSKVKAQAAVQADLFSQIIEVKSKFEYNIEILSNEAWLELFSFWYENVGKSLNVEKIEAFNLKRIREYAEKQAEKEEIFIKSEFLKYNKKIIGK